jgi:hypothetical protein
MRAFLYSKGQNPRILVGSLIFLILPPLVEAQQISFVSPRTVTVGEQIELEFAGKNLGLSGDGNLLILASFDCHQEIISEAPKPPAEGKEAKTRNKVRLKVTLKKDTPVGVGWLRLVTSMGITPPILFLVDDLPTRKVDPKSRREEATLIDPPLAIESRTPNLDVHYYKLEGRSGQRIAIEVFGSRLGEDVDAALKLLDDGGRILAASDDEPGSGKDPRLSHVFRKNQTAYVEVREIRYQGGKFYRLRVGDFPLPMAAFPMVAQTGVKTSFASVGPPGETSLSRSARISGLYGAPSRYSLGFRGSEHNASGFVPLRLVEEPPFIEKEPNNQLSEAHLIESSATLTGRLQIPDDIDVYAFDSKKGQHFHFRPFCRSLGSPAFLLLSLQDEKGRVLASAGNGNSAEESLHHVASADGRIFLLVSELAGRGAPAFHYAISARIQATPLSFHWDAGKASHLTVSGQPGSTVTLKLKSLRKNFAETIELTPFGARGDYEVFGSSSIGKEKGNFDFEIRVPETMKPGEWDLLRLRASFSKEGDSPKEWTDVLDFKSAFQNVLPNIPFPPEELLNRIPMFVMPRKIEVSLDPISGEPGDMVEMKVSLEKKEGTFRFIKPKTSWHGFPKEWKVPVKAQDFDEKKGFAILKFTIPPKAIPGDEIEVFASVRGELENARYMRVFSNRISIGITGKEDTLEETK